MIEHHLSGGVEWAAGYQCCLFIQSQMYTVGEVRWEEELQASSAAGWSGAVEGKVRGSTPRQRIGKPRCTR